MAIKQEHIIVAELADWQTPVKDKDLTTSPGVPSNGDKYIIAGTGGNWLAGTINDIVWYINSEWFFITPKEGMQIYVEDENLYYFYNGSVWGTMSGGSGDMTKAVYDTDNDGIVDKSENIDDGAGNSATASEVKSNVTHTNGDGSDHADVASNSTKVVKNSDNIMLNAFRTAVNGSKAVFNMIDGIVDYFIDESGIDTVNSLNESYNSVNDYYSPVSGQLANSPYAHYKCNDNVANTTVTDNGTGSNNGTASSNTNTLSVTGKINAGFRFTKTNTDSIAITALATGTTGDTIGSVACWIKGDGSTTYGVDWAWEIAGSRRLWGGISSSGIFSVGLRNSSNATQWSFTYSGLGTAWHHCVVVQDGSSVKCYIDGVDVTSSVSWGTETDKSVWLSASSADDFFLGLLSPDEPTTYSNNTIDDFRYYKQVLSSNDVLAIYNSDNGTEDDKPNLSPADMTLISDTFIAEAAPDNVRMVILEEDVDAITLNTDLKVYASNDNGANWHQGMLSDEGNYDASKKVLVANSDVSAQTNTNMIYKLTTHNAKNLKIHASSMSWD